jgi:nucleoside-diphosphate-sugar epimerase
VAPQQDLIASANRIIHTATAWGDPERARQVNVVAVKEMLAAADPAVLEQVIYFSTASILNRDLELLPEAMAYGTEYIQTKAQCLEQLEQHPLAERIVAVFPTLVFGGRVNGSGPFPTSYLTAGLQEGARWLWLAKWLRAEASFHFIHAADIARVCVHLATHPHQANPEPGQGAVRRLVLGQPVVSVNDTVQRLCRWRRSWYPPVGVDLQGWLIEGLIKLLRIEVNAWDRFSIRQRHFVHQPVSPPERFGLVSHAPTLEAVFEDAGLPQRGRV